MRVLAIDQGTSATKAVVVEPDGSTGAVVEVPIAVHAGTDGSVELDPEELWRSVVIAGHRALDAAGGSVDAIGLGNQGETVLAWDRATGQPRSAGIVWQDRRATSVCEPLAAAGWSARLSELTGLELDPYFSAPKMAWLRPHVGDATITTTDTWLLHRLCGAFATDAATASRSLLLGLDDVAWNAEACDVFGIEPADLPSGIRASISGIAAVRRKCAARFGAARIDEIGIDGPFVTGNQFALFLDLVITDPAGGGSQPFTEIALFTVRGGQIAEERYFYA